MLNLVDSFLNTITMYRLVLYGLLGLAVTAILFSFLGTLSFNPFAMLATLGLLFAVCNLTNYAVSKIFKIAINYESATITSFILFLILIPIVSFSDTLHIVLAGVIAMLSKYVLAYKRKHIFNPAAIAAVILGIAGSSIVTWWVGSIELLPIVAIIGLLFVRKVRKFSLFFSFMLAAIVSIISFNFAGVDKIPQQIVEIFTSWPIVFFATVMLTEPLTMPARKKPQMVYGVIVGLIFGANYAFGPIYSTPEMALIIGNVFAFIVSPKARLVLKLQEKIKRDAGIVDFVFKRPKWFRFHAGQYMEWTLPHNGIDSRGNRRYFTLASSPTEDTIRLGVRFYDNSSSFKRALADFDNTSRIAAGQLMGDFVLPDDTTKKLVFIAGGIGVTPFRSIIKYLIDCREKRDIVLFYADKTARAIVYKDIFDEAARSLGIKVVYVLTEEKKLPKGWSGRTGHLTPDIIKQEVPDYADRTFYISGSHDMVTAHQAVLRDVGIRPDRVVVDYFPGFV